MNLLVSDFVIGVDDLSGQRHVLQSHGLQISRLTESFGPGQIRDTSGIRYHAFVYASSEVPGFSNQKLLLQFDDVRGTPLPEDENQRSQFSLSLASMLTYFVHGAVHGWNVVDRNNEVLGRLQDDIHLEKYVDPTNLVVAMARFELDAAGLRRHCRVDLQRYAVKQYEEFGGESDWDSSELLRSGECRLPYGDRLVRSVVSDLQREDVVLYRKSRYCLKASAYKDTRLEVKNERDAWRERIRSIGIQNEWMFEDMSMSQSPVPPLPGNSPSRKVFVVHGHDNEAKETVARFLEKIGLNPIILHEQPSKGKTIIEKIESYSDVSFAVVLLTPDDIGGPVGTKGNNLQPRARQNVMLELGFFLGRLTRERVCALRKSTVEIPSDYDGVVFEKMDEGGGWKLNLAKELESAGLPVDRSKL